MVVRVVKDLLHFSEAFPSRHPYALGPIPLEDLHTLWYMQGPTPLNPGEEYPRGSYTLTVCTVYAQ